MANKLTTILDLDGSKFGRGIKQAIDQVKLADGALNKLKAGWTGAVAAFAASPTALTGLAVGTGVALNKAVDAASNLNESINAVTVSYGANADAVHRMGKESADSFGMSRRAFNEFATTFAMFSANIAGSQGKAPSEVLGDLTERISDIASVKNIDVAEASRVVMSGLAGETEAWRRLGGDVSAYTVEQNAVNMGLAESVGLLTQNDKILSRYTLIMRQSDRYAGDFKNTQDQLANQQRTLAANTEDLAASFGGKLVPIVADAAGIVNHLIGTYDDLVRRASGGDGDKGFFGDLVTGLTDPGAALGVALDQLDRGMAHLDEALGHADGEAGTFQITLDRLVNTIGVAVDPTLAVAEGLEAVGGAAASTSDEFDRLAFKQELRKYAEIDLADAIEAQAQAEEDRVRALQRAVSGFNDYERSQLDVADAQDSLTEAQDNLNRLLTEGTVSAEEKANADRSVADAQESQADAAQSLAEAHDDLDRVIASSIPTDEEKADSIRSVEDAQRGLEDAIRGVNRAARDAGKKEQRVQDLRDELKDLNRPQPSAAVQKTQAFKKAEAARELAEKRVQLLADIEEAEMDAADAQQGIRDAQRDVTDATAKLNKVQAEHNRLMTEGKDVDDKKREALERVSDAEDRLHDAVRDTKDAQRERNELLASSIATDEQKEQATRDIERAELDLAAALEGQAAAFAAQKGAVDGTAASLALQRAEMERIISLSPQYATALQPLVDLLSGSGAGLQFAIPSGVLPMPASQVGGTTVNHISLNVQQAMSPAEVVTLAAQYDRFNGRT